MDLEKMTIAELKITAYDLITERELILNKANTILAAINQIQAAIFQKEKADKQEIKS